MRYPLLIVVLIAALIAPLPAAAGSSDQIVSPDRDQLVQTQINRVVDGDTVHVDLDGSDETIRLIGIDTPETVDPRQGVGCFGVAASDFTKRVLSSGTGVWLEQDISDTDRYARLLRYIWIEYDEDDDRFDGLETLDDAEDGDLISFNLLLVAEGFAASSPYAPDVKHQDAFDAAETAAREDERGLWGECSAFGVPAGETAGEAGQADAGPTVTATEAATEATTGSGGDACDPSYPGSCIPPISVSGDLDCGDVAERRFQVVPPDPHGFDGNSDGVGCEG